ncbi:MAG: trypsin-like peptidase domain-containing protein [Chloroflexi bacterium]|nr:trypsin-like peptidase domain-containing protein [Chloroflexota bacterium]MCL5275764.1 trypsin-like peptidase domain-containing protein [Chloroflexota bacterium]
MNLKHTGRVGVQLLAATSMVLLIAGCQFNGLSAVQSSTAINTAAAASNAVTKTALQAANQTTSSLAPVVSHTIDAAQQTSPTTSSAPITSSNFATAVRDVAARVKPAVVQITNQQVQIDQFNQSTSVPAGVGSGVIYDAQGHILTNNHVIAGADKLLVSLPDGRSFPAKVVGADPQTDLAVLQISGANLPVAQLGDSNQLQVGDWVVAIGNALALPGGPTVTAGVVSAVGRTVQEPADQNGNAPFLFDAIQTSAPINPGNSGGPLVNLSGQVIGINTLVAGQAEPGVPSQGIGFAISLAAARPIADQLVATGHVTHTYLGIRYLPLNAMIASRLGTTQKSGIVVMSVVSNSPASKAGLQQQDIITAADGKNLVDESSLARVLSTHKPDDKIELKVVRGTRTLTLTVTLAELPAQ